MTKKATVTKIPEPVRRGPGRPAIGERTTARLDAETLAAVDRFAAGLAIQRAEAIRRLVVAGLAAVGPVP
jgi:hypothetical protein